MIGRELEGRRVLVTQSEDYMGPPIAARFREAGAEVTAVPGRLVELAAIDALDSQSGSELDTLEMFTQDRSEMMTRIRRNFFNSEQELSRDERNFVLDITILFENSVQSLARYGTILKAS